MSIRDHETHVCRDCDMAYSIPLALASLREVELRRLIVAVMRYYADTMPGYAAAAGLTQTEYDAVMVDVRRARQYVEEES